ncbi:MAG: hypothetical protein GXO86_11140, partial [Chlorobi bacterium]|nr:hypothetical protein [Chlorobiota bacterium]
LKLKPEDAYAAKQIRAVVDKMKASQAKEEKYYDIIDLADVFFDEGAYDKALAQYRKALGVIPGDAYAQDQIAKIQRKRAEQKDKLISYNLAMQEGARMIAKDNYDSAIIVYREAQRLLPDRKEPAEKIAMVTEMQKGYEKKIGMFKEAVQKGDQYMLIEDYVTALSFYQKAHLIFPGNKTVNKKIKDIEGLADKQLKYNGLIEKADELYISKDFIAARAKYREASKAWPENNYPKDMMQKIDDLLTDQRKNLDRNYTRYIRSADSLYNIEEYELAKGDYNMALTLKPDEKYPQSRLKDIENYYAEQQKKFEADYKDMIAKADKLFDEKKYKDARVQYNMALKINPDDEYPKQKLNEIDKQEKLIAIAAQQDSAYNAIVAEADRLYSSGHYDLAIKKYTEAQAIKSMDSYPQQQIDQIQQYLANAEKQREIDEKFGQVILLAGRLFKEDKLDEARKAYQNALELKPGDPLPQKEITRIDSVVQARIQQQKMEKQYKALIAQADSLVGLKEYAQAIAIYSEALEVNPKGQEADKKRLEARTMKINYEKALALEADYKKLIGDGDKLFKEKNYELAKVEYEKALNLKAGESYPRQQIGEINTILKKLEAEREQRYQEAVTKADNLYDHGDYNEAARQYKIATSIKPGVDYPSRRLAECNTKIEEELRKAKAKYDITIADGDKLYAARIYDKAILAYKKAEDLMPDESYAREMIGKITRYIEENAIVDVIRQTVQIKNGVSEKFSFKPIPVKFRKTNYVLIKAKNLGDKPFKIIFSYGSDKGKNGGFVVPVPANGEYNDFIIRVGNQYKWFSDDNNWISILPELGDIEIKLVRISTAE